MKLSLQPATVPPTASFPASVKEWLSLIAKNVRVVGGDNIEGVVIQQASPALSDQDKLWVRTDAFNRVVGLFVFYGEWTQIPTVPRSGEVRPTNPLPGEQFYDEDIEVLIVYERGAWRTVAGVPGDVKFVQLPTLEQALKKNPGWVQLEDAMGRVLVAAGEGTGLTNRPYGAIYGAEEVELVEDNLPPHTHSFDRNKKANSPRDGDAGSPVDGILATTETITTTSVGDSEPFDISQPSMALWCLVKQ